jgi:Mg/Co/Ni transporter MgtE
LPDNKKEAFTQSDARNSMENIINTLQEKEITNPLDSANPEDSADSLDSADPSTPADSSDPLDPLDPTDLSAFTSEKIVRTLSYLESLSGGIKDKELIISLHQKVQNIRSKILATADKRQNQ